MSTGHTWINSKNTNKRQNKLLYSLLDALESRFASGEVANQSLVSLLSSLASHLQVHFEWDESSIDSPGFEGRSSGSVIAMEQLKNEQTLLLHEVEILVSLARLACAEKQDTKTLADRYRAFRSKFAAHESAERAFTQDVFGSVDLAPDPPWQ